MSGNGFFLVKKKQKTFIIAELNETMAAPMPSEVKDFLVLFYKKEPLPSFL
jgi:hypothetical protein